MLLWMIAIACTGETGGAGSDDSDGGGGGGGNEDAPVIQTMDVYCCNPASGPEAWYWALTALVSDPQGVETIAGIGEGHQVNVRGSGGGGGEPIVDYGAGFSCDEKGVCDTSWSQNADNIMCSNASNYEIELIVADQDGNLSDPSTMLGVATDC